VVCGILDPGRVGLYGLIVLPISRCRLPAISVTFSSVRRGRRLCRRKETIVQIDPNKCHTHIFTVIFPLFNCFVSLLLSVVIKQHHTCRKEAKVFF